MTLAVRLPPEVEQRLSSLAERTGRSKASYAREAIVRYLEDLEDEQLALERFNNPERRWTLDEFVFRFNRRTANNLSHRFARLVEHAVQIPPTTYRSLVAVGAT